MSEPFLIDLERRDDVCILHLKGRFVTGEDPRFLRAKKKEISTRKCNRLLVDLREVPFIGSSGIGFLVGLYTSITKTPNGRFVLVGPNARVLEVLDLTRLSTIIPLAEDIVSGMVALGAESVQPATKTQAL